MKVSIVAIFATLSLIASSFLFTNNVSADHGGVPGCTVHSIELITTNFGNETRTGLSIDFDTSNCADINRYNRNTKGKYKFTIDPASGSWPKRSEYERLPLDFNGHVFVKTWNRKKGNWGDGLLAGYPKPVYNVCFYVKYKLKYEKFVCRKINAIVT